MLEVGKLPKTGNVIIMLTNAEYCSLIDLAESTGICSEIKFGVWNDVWKEAFAWIKAVPRLVWEVYPPLLSSKNKTRFDIAIKKYVAHLQSEQQTKAINLELSNARKLEAVEEYLKERILDYIAEARESLEIACKDLVYCTGTQTYTRCEDTQHWCWKELQRRLAVQWIAEDILEIIQSKEN